MKQLILSVIITLTSLLAYSQSDPFCKDINLRNINIVDSKQFVPDGRFYAFKLAPGEKMDIYKPFFAAKDYYLVVSCDDFLPGVKVTLFDVNKNVIYDSLAPQKQVEFDYKPDKNQNVIISLVVDKITGNSINTKGCVSMVVGYK